MTIIGSIDYKYRTMSDSDPNFRPLVTYPPAVPTQHDSGSYHSSISCTSPLRKANPAELVVLADLALTLLISNMQSGIRKKLRNALFTRQSKQRNTESAANMMKRPRTGTPNMTTKMKTNRKSNIAMMKLTL